MPPKRRKLSKTIERKIHFYRIDAGVNVSGKPLIYDPVPALNKIKGLPVTDEKYGRYLTDEDGNAIGVWPELVGVRTALRFCQVRRNGLPQVEQAGVVNELNIADDAGLLEPVHVVFFADNIVGADFNFYGPRLSRLGYYLSTKTGMDGQLLQFMPLLRQDVAAQLNRLDEISLFDLRIKSSYAQSVSQRDESLDAAIKANLLVLGDDTEDVQLILRAARGRRRGAFRRLGKAIKDLISSENFRENTERFQVRGRMNDTGKIDTIDLLKDQLIATKQILRLGERSRAVQAESAFQAIETAHAELKDSLLIAAGLRQ
jgi:hypothetical protein